MRNFIVALAAAATAAQAHAGRSTQNGQLEIPITPFSNMASGYQATNPGFRAILRSNSGRLIAGGEMTIDAVIRGTNEDASSGSAYGKLVLNLDVTNTSQANDMINGTYKGKLSICMAKDTQSSIADTQCKSLGGNIHEERPFQWIDKQVDYEVKDGDIRISRYYGDTGEGGTSKQISLAVFHPAYGFAAPGKAFKDYQSPLVLDLNGNGKADLLNVWNEKRAVYFDANGKGQRIRTGWVNPQDGLLFIDDGSGCAKNGTQLFGEYTGSTDGNRTFSNGFAALQAKVSADKPGVIVAANHPELKVWRNWAMDGVCKPQETYPLSQFAKELSVEYQSEGDTSLNEDNEVRFIGSFIDKKGKTQLMADVWFKQRWEQTEPPVTSQPNVNNHSSAVTNRRPIDIATVANLRSYAESNSYYLPVNLKEGMKVSYSASYGIGGEAGQSYGVLVRENGRLWFRQLDNPTSQLMLPPGLTFNSNANHSLWDMEAYMNLINRVAFSAANEASHTTSDIYGTPAAALVDFKGGTAGQTIEYKDALEVVFQKSTGNRSNSDARIYYAKGIGPVCLEFRENLTPSGTFKIFLGK